MMPGSNRKSHLRGELKKKAIKLRSKGLSYNEIVKKVPVVKSTISLWCRYVKLSPKQRKKLQEQSGRGGIKGIQAIQTMFWQKRCDAFGEGVNLSYRLTAINPKFIAGLMLYWAEGTKNSSTAATNSDSRIIKFMTLWLKEFFYITPEQITISLQLHSDQNENKVKKYWSKITRIPLSNFRKSFVKPQGSGLRKRILQNGTVKIVVKKSGSTYLLFKILGAINGFLELTINESLNPKNWMSVLPYARPAKLNKYMRP